MKFQYSNFKKYIINYLKNGLDNKLYYHCLNHTFHVLKNCIEIAKHENISQKELKLLKTAVLLHDCGFVVSYNNHEEFSSKFAKENLENFGYNKEEIEIICSMIMATRIPQQPKNLLENIIADADLMYFGTDSYNEISDTLKQELLFFSPSFKVENWLDIQINFLEKHTYHTSYCNKVYNKKKKANLKKLKQLKEK